MKKKLIMLLMILALVLFTVTMTYAWGDMNRGDKALGDAWQHQLNDPPPFEP